MSDKALCSFNNQDGVVCSTEYKHHIKIKGDILCRLFLWLREPLLRGAEDLFLLFFQREASTHQHKEQRHEEDSQHRGGYHPANYAGAYRVLAA